MSPAREDGADWDGVEGPATASVDGGPGGPFRSPGRLLSRRNTLILAAGALGAVFLPIPGRDGPRPRQNIAEPSTSEDEHRLNVRDFGARGDGSTDDTAAVQAMIDATAATGRSGLVPAGTYRCTSSLRIPADARLYLDDGARLSKDWAAPPGLAEAFLRNADFMVRSDGVRIMGPGTIGAADHSRTGVVLALYGDDIRLSDFTIDTYAGGQAIMFAGDRGRIDRVRVLNSARTTGTGGIRVIGGQDFRASGCHVESGDDSLQFAPIADPGALLYDMDIGGGTFEACTGASSVSRFMVAVLEWTRGDTGMTASISDCSFRGCRGAATDRAIAVRNTHSSGAIERLAFTDCGVDMAFSEDPSYQCVRVQTNPVPGGAIRDLSFTRTDIVRPGNTTLRISGPGISRLAFDGCAFVAPTGAAPVTAVVDGAESVVLRNCTFLGTPARSHLVVGPGDPVTGLELQDCLLRDTADGSWAIELASVHGARVSGTTVRAAPGATAARAIRVAPPCRRVVIENNDFTALRSATAIADLAPDTVLQGNRGA